MEFECIHFTSILESNTDTDIHINSFNEYEYR
jgi:hypothetical protein